MATRRTTFSKTQRERDKRAKAAAKRERRAAVAEEPAEPAPVIDHEAVAKELASLHERYADGRVSFEDFVARRDELQDSLHI